MSYTFITYLLYRATSTHINLNIISQYLNTLFTGYREPYVKDINDMDEVEGNQGQVQALVLTSNQDLLIDLQAMRNEIISMY